MRRLLKTSELAKALNVSARTLQRWRNEGWITPEFVTMGGQARWIEEDVRRQVREAQEAISQDDDA